MELSTVRTKTTWNDAASAINSNTQKIGLELYKLKNATYKNKGYFASAEALVDAYPQSRVGAKAYVGTSYPYAIYVWDAETQTWVDSGETGGEESIPLNDYYTKEETQGVLEDYHIVLTEDEYEALEIKEDKFYFTYEEE